MLLIDHSELNNYKSKDLLEVKCDYCKVIFKRKQSQIKSDLKIHNRTKHYCRRKCKDNSQQAQVEVSCKFCEKTFFKIKSQLRSANSFCSSSCSAKYNNTHKTNGTKRSKLESYLEKELIEFYPDLDFHFNRKDAINSELDIYLPELKLAFELNGIFHYEPIFGQEKLNKIQNNDNRKFQACIEKGIELCIIDTSHLTYFKPEKGEKFLEIIKNIINQNISKNKI